MKLREGKPCAQGCRAWEWQSQDLNPGVSCPRAYVCSWRRLSYSDVNFPPPSPVISLPFGATCAATLWRAQSGPCCWLSPPHLRWVGMWPWTMGDLVFHHLFREWGTVGPWEAPWGHLHKSREPSVSCLNPGKPSRDLLQHVSRPDTPSMARVSFISFSCLTALARASSTILKRIVTVGFCLKQKQWFLS